MERDIEAVPGTKRAEVDVEESCQEKWDESEKQISVTRGSNKVQLSSRIKGTGHVWQLSKTSILTWCISTFECIKCENKVLTQLVIEIAKE